MTVPFGAPISIPLWLLPHLAPNLDVTVPETGLISDIPKFTTLPDVLVPVAATAVDDVVFFTTFFSYKSATTFSVVTYSACSVEYFSIIPNLSLLLLFFSFKSLIACSASANVLTFSFSSLSTVIA